LLEVLPEVKEEAVEDGEGKGEDGLLLRDAVLQEGITEGLFDDCDEFFAVEEGGPGALNHRQNKLETEDSRPHREGIHHTILTA